MANQNLGSHPTVVTRRMRIQALKPVICFLNLFIMNQPETKLLKIFKNAGVNILDQEKALEVLHSSDLLDMDRDKVFKEIGIDRKNLSEDQLKQLVKNNIVDVYGEIIKKGFRETIKKVDIESYFSPENIAIRNEYRSNMDPNKASQHIKDVVKDQDSQFRQGYHWNVLISEKCPYVLKFIKHNDSALRSAENHLQNYLIMKSVIGEEFFAKQTVIRLKESRRQVILQEKLNPKEWSSLSAYQEVFENLSNVAKQSENKAKLDRFLNGIQRLSNEHRLLVDALGDNIFYKINDEGNLNIKLIDYGCFDPKNPKNSSQTQSVEKFLNELRKL